MSEERPLRIDLHTHTHYSPDGITSPQRLVQACVRKGITCVAVTDHNTIHGALAVKEIAPFRVIVGEEIRSAEGEIIGLFLSEEVPPGLSAQDTIERIRSQGGLVSLPHPTDRFRGGVGAEGLAHLAPLVDIVEVMNARTTLGRDNDEAARLAGEHGLVAVAVSDAHSPWEIGRVYVEAPDYEGVQEFLEALRWGTLVGRPSSSLVHLLSRYAWLRRKLGWRPTDA
ncbi:MAG: PHP domain-containing protein [Chloroflexi bacterium]|nr:PHP domain-containing protein [Chloroflexota bacterium]